MISHTTDAFRRALAWLPKHVQDRAHDAYQLFSANPYHPSLQFKRLLTASPIYSVRITADYRALGWREDNEIIWYWIGPHSEYDRLIAETRKRM